MQIRACLILALLVAADALAAEARAAPLQTANYQGSEAQRQACTPDVFRLCGQFIPDVPNIVACLKAQKPNLSPDCRATFEGRLR